VDLDDLARLAGAETVVRVVRTRGDALDGLIAGVGRNWLLLHVVHDLNLCGLTAVRLGDVRRVKIDRSGHDVVIRSLRQRGLVPSAAVDMNLDRTTDVLADLQSRGTLLTIHPDHRWPGTCHVGTVTNIDANRRRFHFLELSPSAAWDETATVWRFRDVRRIDISDPYAEALAAVAGPPPSR